MQISGLKKYMAPLKLLIGLACSECFTYEGLIAPASFFLGLMAREFIMMFANFVLIYIGLLQVPPSYGEVTLIFVLSAGVFNVQGTISIAEGYLIYVAVKRRVPSMRAHKNMESL